MTVLSKGLPTDLVLFADNAYYTQFPSASDPYAGSTNDWFRQQLGVGLTEKDRIDMQFTLDAGTYDVTFVGSTSTSSGKVDWYVDGELWISGQDWYANPGADNVQKSASLTLATPGAHLLAAQINGKNPLSGGLAFYFNFVQFRRTTPPDTTTWYVIEDDHLPAMALCLHDESTVVTGNALVQPTTVEHEFGRPSYQNPPTLNDTFRQSLFLRAGTYNLIALGTINTSYGIQTWSIDGQAVGTMDWYYTSPLAASRRIENIEITTNGVHVVESKVTSKNASSTGYYIVLTCFLFQPVNPRRALSAPPQAFEDLL